MKRIILMLMLTAITAITAQAQVTMYASTGGQVVGSVDSIITSAATTYYALTPLNSLNSATSGKVRIAFEYRSITTWTATFIIQGRIATGSTDSSWVNVHQVQGQDGKNCDTLQVTAMTVGAGAGWVFNCAPGAVHNVLTSATAVTPWYSSAGRFLQYRLVVINTTGTGAITKMRALTQL